MPFEQKYTPETRDASLAEVLERRASEPGNRSIIRETAEKFEVGEQSLRGWIRAWEKVNAPEADAPEDEAPATAPEPTPAAPVAQPDATPRRAPSRSAPSAAASAAATDSRVADLEAEVAKLRRDREALKSALAVLLSE